MKGLTVGTVLSIMEYRFVVDSTDEDGNSFIKQIGAVPTEVSNALREKIRDDINSEKKKKKKTKEMEVDNG
jgi:hypothetical protein